MDIRLTLVNDTFTGIEALDRRRLLGLPDGDQLTFTTESNQAGKLIPKLEVDEGFARAWFGPKQTTSYAHVPISMLVKGDVTFCNTRNDSYVTFAELPAERIKELYVAVRFAACRDEVARLQQEVDTLNAELEATEEADLNT